MAEKHDGFSHHYVHDDGEPLLECPECGQELTAPEGVVVLLCISGVTAETRSRLDENGLLVDTNDGAVAKGFHAGTQCGCCYANLCDYETEE